MHLCDIGERGKRERERRGEAREEREGERGKSER